MQAIELSRMATLTARSAKNVILVAIAAKILTACGSANPSGCSPISPPRLLYPKPGATGIADGHLALWFGYPVSPAVAFSRPRISSAGATIVGGAYATPSPGPLPPGAASPAPNDQVFVSSVASYTPATTYSVVLGRSACVSEVVGTFKTK